MTTWHFDIFIYDVPKRCCTYSIELDTDIQEEAIERFSKEISVRYPEAHFDIISVRMQPFWFCDELYEKLNALVHELDKVLMALRSTADFYETESLEFKLKLLLERFDGISDTIEMFYHTRLHFSRTDEYFGVCDNEERYLIKVNRK